MVTRLVVLSTTNMRIYNKLAIGHLMQSWVRFVLQCFSNRFTHSIITTARLHDGDSLLHCSCVVNHNKLSYDVMNALRVLSLT